MSTYLTIEGFRDLSSMPSEVVDELQAIAPGWLEAKLATRSRWIDARLGKRYAVPFDAASPPECVRDWLARIVTLSAFLRRGVDPTDGQFVEIKADAEKAEAEILEAATAETGLFDLPLRGDTTASGVSRGGTRAYTEASPYVGHDRQAAAGHLEDRNGGGSYV